MAKIISGDRVGAKGRLRIGCSVAVWDASPTRILLMRRSDNGLWSLPSGGMDPGESLEEAAKREVMEESGLEVEVTGMIGVYSSPHVLVEYADGNRFQIVSACLEATVIGGNLTTSDEATEVRFFSREELAALPVMENHIERIDDAFAFNGKTIIK